MTRLLTIILLICLLALPALAAKPWQVLDGCRMVESTINDGDSFRVHWNGGEVTIRLYFTDTPESDNRFMDRTRDQAAYFGISEEQAVEAGKLAKAFTRNALRGGFAVRTRWQGVFSGQKGARKYGIVSVGGEDLGELLVANGLARIHGMGIGGKTWEEVERLKALESQAKADKRGAWGMAQGSNRNASSVFWILLIGVLGITLYWRLGWKGRSRSPRWSADHPRPTVGG